MVISLFCVCVLLLLVVVLKGAGGLNFWELFEEFIADELKGQKVCFSCQVAAITEDVVSK